MEEDPAPPPRMRDLRPVFYDPAVFQSDRDMITNVMTVYFMAKIAAVVVNYDYSYER